MGNFQGYVWSLPTVNTPHAIHSIMSRHPVQSGNSQRDGQNPTRDARGVPPTPFVRKCNYTFPDKMGRAMPYPEAQRHLHGRLLSLGRLGPTQGLQAGRCQLKCTSSTSHGHAESLLHGSPD